jgi:aspartate carbamoyltransferase catalytic subunit
MPAHLIDVSDLSDDDIHELVGMADEGPQLDSLAGVTYLSAFFQESTRTRLGFASAAARQGATVLDMGSADRLRDEASNDQQMVLAGVADIVAVRHWDAAFARELSLREQCCVINAGTADISHPTQALIDVYTLMRAFRRDVSGLRVTYVGAFLRSALCFRKLSPMLGVNVTQCEVNAGTSRGEILRRQAELVAADVIYVQSLSDADYCAPDLDRGTRGPCLPSWAVSAIEESSGRIMHALPRGPELPDSLMWDARSLVSAQVANGLPVRSAILRWLIERA